MPWFIQRARQVQTIYADSIEQEVWFRLSENESEFTVRRNLERYYAEEGISISADQLGEATTYFVYSLKQGREYFGAAKSVSILTRPLLLFYGMVCLAKLLALLKDPSFPGRMASERELQQHGLGYEDHRTDGLLVESDVVKIKPSGTFSSLYGFFRSELPDQLDFRVGELYGWIPDLFTYMGERIPHQVPYVNSRIAHEGESIRISVEVKNRRSLASDVLAQFDYLVDDFAEEDGIHKANSEASQRPYPRDVGDRDRPEVIRSLVKELEEYLSGKVAYDLATREYLVPPTEKMTLNPLLANYMIMYSFSRACRYQPDKWGRMIEGRESGERWLAEKLVDLSFRSFPLGIYSVFCGQPVIVTTP